MIKKTARVVFFGTRCSNHSCLSASSVIVILRYSQGRGVPRNFHRGGPSELLGDYSRPGGGGANRISNTKKSSPISFFTCALNFPLNLQNTWYFLTFFSPGGAMAPFGPNVGTPMDTVTIHRHRQYRTQWLNTDAVIIWQSFLFIIVVTDTVKI